MPCLAGHARLRDDGRRALLGQCRGAQKKPIANTQKLIRWSIQELCRLAVKVTQAQIPIPHILRWSVFRRRHQATAYLSRTQTKAQL